MTCRHDKVLLSEGLQYPIDLRPQAAILCKNRDFFLLRRLFIALPERRIPMLPLVDGIISRINGWESDHLPAHPAAGHHRRRIQSTDAVIEHHTAVNDPSFLRRHELSYDSRPAARIHVMTLAHKAAHTSLMVLTCQFCIGILP